MEMKKKEKIGWIDLLRVLACFLVVFSHCCDPFVAQFDNDRSSFLSGVLAGSFVRACVPLFVMMTGVLLFPVRMGMSDFYKKRVGRIVVPLVFWSLALPVLYFVYINYLSATQNPAIVPEHFTASETVRKMYTFIFNFNYDTTPLWYLYMLLGLYLVIPVFGVWLKEAPQRDMRLFLWVWGVSLVLPYVKMAAPLLGYAGNYGNMGILGICDWNDYGTFYYVSGFIGYLVLAHYLVRFPLTWSWKKMLAITVPMFLVGYAITSYGYLLTQKFFPGNYANLEIIWYFAGINVFMMTFPVFVIIQKSRVAPSAFMSRLASLTFGIYLCHFIFVQMAYDWFGGFQSLPVIVRILVMALTAFLISAVLVRILSCFKWGRRLVM